MKVDPRSFKGLSRFLAPSAGGPVADRALQENLITADQLQQCIEEQDQTGRPLDELLVDRGFLKAEEVERLRSPAVPPEVLPHFSNPERVLGHYVLVSILGTGGMAEVWKAWDRSLGRWVAVKYMKEEIGHPTQRIEREGRMAGQLSHPSIISIFERSMHQGRAYLVMPYVAGAPPKSPLPHREAARLALEVAHALHHAHQSGVIHRDVKPANILVEAGGRVVLADFGLAILDETATSRWAMSGTPEYASPEQIRGDRLDLRTDIYSLGATLYHLLAGRPPFTGDNAEDITLKVLNQIPPPIVGIPRGLSKILKRAMCRDREQRYPSMKEFAATLEKWMEQSNGGFRLKPMWLAVGVLSAVLSWAATFSILFYSQRQDDRQRILEALRDGDRHMAAAERRLSDPAGDAALAVPEARSALSDYTLALRWAGGNDPEAAYGMGQCYEILGDEAKAEEAYQSADGLSAARSALAWIWARRLLEGRQDRDWRAHLQRHLDPRHAVRRFAEGKWEEVLRSGPADHDEEKLDLLQGAAAIELQRWDEALRLLAKGLRIRPHDATILFYKGVALAGNRDSRGAEDAWKDALRNAPKSWALRGRTEERLAASEKK
jgi:tetratricopeptide (TPR) repeat protein